MEASPRWLHVLDKNLSHKSSKSQKLQARQFLAEKKNGFPPATSCGFQRALIPSITCEILSSGQCERAGECRVRVCLCLCCARERSPAAHCCISPLFLLFNRTMSTQAPASTRQREWAERAWKGRGSPFQLHNIIPSLLEKKKNLTNLVFPTVKVSSLIRQI